MDILGTTAFMYVKQPKRFLPLAKEAKRLAEEIRIEKLNEQWAGIPHKKTAKPIFSGLTKFVANSGTTGTFRIGQAASSC